jgi:hypothetical protein
MVGSCQAGCWIQMGMLNLSSDVGYRSEIVGRVDCRHTNGIFNTGC